MVGGRAQVGEGEGMREGVYEYRVKDLLIGLGSGLGLRLRSGLGLRLG